jgi:hypothetical protein
MNVKAVVSIVAGLLAANCVNAAEVGTSISLGSTGLGLHLSTPITSKLNARLGLNYASYSYNGNTDDVDYDFKLKLATVDALLDYHPMDGAFRISGGVVYNGNNIDAVAKPNASQPRKRATSPARSTSAKLLLTSVSAGATRQKVRAGVSRWIWA